MYCMKLVFRSKIWDGGIWVPLFWWGGACYAMVGGLRFFDIGCLPKLSMTVVMGWG